MKLTQLFLCSAALALPLTLQAATKKSDDRWFDVEIILFSQLGDKNQLQESFPDTSELPKHRRVEDLLRWYLTPDIRSLKQLLPSCDSPMYGENLVNENAKLPAIFNEKSLAELSLIANEASENNISAPLRGQENNQMTDSSRFSDAANSTKIPVTTIESTGLNTLTANNIQNGETVSTPLDNNALALQTGQSDAERVKTLSLVLAAEQAFKTITFQYSPAAEPKLLCRIDQAYFADYQSLNPNFDYYGFAVDKVPLLIDGQEAIGNSKTHLLSKDSLKLDDVIKDLRYSKNFRPLLHMGWRQVARPEKLSVPVRVYAGENFAADYQQKLTRFNDLQSQQKSKALNYTREQKPLASLSPQHQGEENQIAQLQVAQQARIEKIIAQISQVNENTDELLASFEEQDLSLKLNNENPVLSVPPKAPVQQWFIDGFFNIHLKHYLFITADFNILDKNLSELATAQLSNSTEMGATTSTPIQAKAIRFKQDRRVISGEVHYFDHPYIGMVVQIRPYTMPKQKADH